MKGQQIGLPSKSGTSYTAKRYTKRRRRREEGRDPENAPTRIRYRFYT